ncbi:MAG: citrate synthase [Micrococcaceae bacterium]
MANKTAKLNIDGNELEFPIEKATKGSSGINIGPLLKQTGSITYDVGFMNTASCKSSVTFIDGDKGILQYRGYPIEQLAENSDYIEVSYLLVTGKLPSKKEREEFEAAVVKQMHIPEELDSFFATMPQESHPMPMLSAAVSVLATHYGEKVNARDGKDLRDIAIAMLAQVPVLAARILRHIQGEKPINDTPYDTFTENFYNMCFGSEEELDADKVKALDTLLLLHADHEQNCSTSTVRLVGSAETNLFASISAGINALYGPLHGGANEAVLSMLHQIHNSGDSIDEFLTKVKNKEEGVKLMGFGHRVYKNYDPRAKIVKSTADTVLGKSETKDELLELAQELEATALEDDYFKSRKLYPNVDFYSGLIYQSMGFPEHYFTILFAVGRMPGWIAQWAEMVADKETKIGRPRQVYIGDKDLEYPKHD